MEFKFRLTRKRTAAAVVAAALTAVGIGYAAIPSNGTYTACKLRATGTIRLIDKSLPSSSLLSKCTAFEDEISWEQGGATALGKDSVDSFMVKDQTLTADDIGTGAVKNDELDGNAVTTDKIANGTVKAEDVATGSNGLTGSNVADGSLTGADLAAGSVTTDKQTANYSSSLQGGDTTVLVPAVGQSSPNNSTQITLINPDSTAHHVLLTGQATFTGNSVATEVLSPSVQLFEGATNLTSAIKGQLDATSPTTTLPTQVVVSADPGTHTYTLQLNATTFGVSADRLVNVSAPSLIAVDLGR